MTGGLLNIVSYGNLNVILNGNPKKNFFLATYKKYTNFGLQKHIISCNVTNRRLRENNPSTFDFSIPRWGDLITDTFFRIQMPHIWSPIFVEPSDIYDSPGGVRGLWANETDIIPNSSNNFNWPSDYARDPLVLPENGPGPPDFWEPKPTPNNTPFPNIWKGNNPCNDTTCSPENNPIYNPNNGDGEYIEGCGELIGRAIAFSGGPDEFTFEPIIDNPCIAVNKVVPGLYNINDISGTGDFFPREVGWAHPPYVEAFEFKWIENLGSQLMRNITLSAGGLILQKFSGEYLMNMVNRDFSYEKKELFNEMTGNIKEMNDPSFASRRNGLYPNSLFGAPLINTINIPINTDTSSGPLRRWLKPSLYQYRVYENIEDITSKKYNLRTNLNPSIFKRSLCIPLNLYYMFSSTKAFPLVSMIHNELRISIECRPIRELFKVRDIRTWINTYYGHNLALGKITKNGSGESIYKFYDPEYYNNGGKFFSQKNIFYSQIRAPYISTMNTVDPLYQMYMFTTQYAAQNQQYVRQAIFRSKIISEVQEKLRAEGIWDANPELVCTYVYLDYEEQQVFRKRPQSYLITQIQEYLFEKKNHKEFTIDRFKSNSIVKNWMWYQIRSDVKLRNEWSNYTNWAFSTKYPYTLQPMFHTELSMNWYDPETGLAKVGEQPVWETNTLNTGNPNILIKDFVPRLGAYITRGTEPGNYRVNRYIKQIPRGLVDDYTWLPYISDRGTFPGAVSIWPGMDKIPPYFPYTYIKTDLSFNSVSQYKNGVNPYVTGPLQAANKKTIFKQWGLMIDGKLREDKLNSEYYNLVEPFVRSSGNLTDGLYTYNFGINSDPFILDPNGGINLIDYKHIEFEYTSINTEVLDDISSVAIIPLCLPRSETIQERAYGYNKIDWQIYEYSFDLKIMEEQYNYLTISDGLASLKYNTAV